MDPRSFLSPRSPRWRALGVVVGLGLALGVAAAAQAPGAEKDAQTSCGGPVITAFNLSWDPARGCVVGGGTCDFSKNGRMDGDE